MIVKHTRASLKSFVKSKMEHGISRSSEHWNTTRGLSGIYQALNRRNFFEHGSWPIYLQKEIGIKPAFIGKTFTRDKIKFFIQEKAAVPNMNMRSNYWIKNRILRPYLKAVIRNKFFGKDSWQRYLEEEIGIVPLKRVGRFLLPGHPTRESLMSFVRARIKDGTNMGTANWRYTKGLSAVFGYLQLNRFFGYKTWKKYLEVECEKKVNVVEKK